MGVCWYCTWGWPKQTADIYEKYLKLLDGREDILEFGPGHIVWSDENFETEHIQWCIEHSTMMTPFEESYKCEWGIYNEMTAREFIIAVDSLRELLKVPENIRCCCPDNYPDDNDADPKDYPPADGIIMIKKY